MKVGFHVKRFYLVLCLILFAIYAQAATVTLAWDAMPAGESWTSVRIYERTGIVAPYTYAQVASVACPGCTTAVVTVTAVGNHTYVARSYNGTIESADSNSVLVNVPAPPVNLKITSLTASVNFFGTTFRAQTSVPAKTTLTVNGKTYTVDTRLVTSHTKSLFGRLTKGTPYTWTATDAQGNKATATGTV